MTLTTTSLRHSAPTSPTFPEAPVAVVLGRIEGFGSEAPKPTSRLQGVLSRASGLLAPTVKTAKKQAIGQALSANIKSTGAQATFCYEGGNIQGGREAVARLAGLCKEPGVAEALGLHFKAGVYASPILFSILQAGDALGLQKLAPFVQGNSACIYGGSCISDPRLKCPSVATVYKTVLGVALELHGETPDARRLLGSYNTGACFAEVGDTFRHISAEGSQLDGTFENRDQKWGVPARFAKLSNGHRAMICVAQDRSEYIVAQVTDVRS